MIRQGDRFYDETENKYYRMRRGKMVEIPLGWVNRVTTPCTIRHRDSKISRCVARATDGKKRVNKGNLQHELLTEN